MCIYTTKHSLLGISPTQTEQQSNNLKQSKQVALVDRNCHKSIEQGLIITGGIPQYMVRCRVRVLWNQFHCVFARRSRLLK